MNLFYLDKVDSTNKYAKEHINEIADKTVVYTFNQTNGRGRFDRKWCNIGEDNIYASIVLKPSREMKEVYSNLTQYLCVVLAETIEEYGVSAQIKWPNDIQISGKKISGILAEGCISSGKLEGLVLGVGINLNAEKENLYDINQPATALNIEARENIDKNIFLNKMIEKFSLRYEEFLEKGFKLIKNDYIKRANFLDKEITVKVLENKICGKAIEITNNGALKIVDKNKKEHILFIGDII